MGRVDVSFRRRAPRVRADTVSRTVACFFAAGVGPAAACAPRILRGVGGWLVVGRPRGKRATAPAKMFSN